jgi:glutamate racemase
VAVLGTTGTIQSGSYRLELAKLAPRLNLVEQACPILVPLVEAGELSGPGVDYFLHKYLDPLLIRSQHPTRILLGCTHYPLLLPAIRSILPASIEIISQGPLVAARLADWLARHPEVEQRLSKKFTHTFLTTEDPDWFREKGEPILQCAIHVDRVHLSLITG